MNQIAVRGTSPLALQKQRRAVLKLAHYPQASNPSPESMYSHLPSPDPIEVDMSPTVQWPV